MESDSFFCQLFKQLPQTLFELIDLPAKLAKAYRFDSVEVKKSFRIDGLFVPRQVRLPFYIVEVQFQRVEKFYANLFAKVFWYLEQNHSEQEWVAVAIFPSRDEEPEHRGPYEDLLGSKRVKRIYLDTLPNLADPPPGVGILQLLSATPEKTKVFARRLVEKTRAEYGNTELERTVIQLAEELLIRRFSEFSREEVRKMFHLEDLRKTRVWQEANEEGKITEREDTIRKCLAKGMTPKEIADLLGVPLSQIRRLAKNQAH